MYYVFMVRGLGFGCNIAPDMSIRSASLAAAFCSDRRENDPARAGEGEIGSCGRPSYEAVLRLYHRKVYNLAYRLLSDADEAADLTQETFVKAYKAYSKFQGTTEAAYPWLCRIAVNCCKNRFKELSRRKQYEAQSLDEPTPGVPIADGTANPAGIVERRDLEIRIQDAVRALPPEFRIVVVLRDMQGLSYREIAEATGSTLEIVKVRLFRGRAMLRRRLSPYVEE